MELMGPVGGSGGLKQGSGALENVTWLGLEVDKLEALDALGAPGAACRALGLAVRMGAGWERSG